MDSNERLRQHRGVLIERLCVCPTCHGALVFVAGGLGGVECVRCQRTFPIVDGAPIMVADPRRYLIDVAKQYERTFAVRERLITKLKLAMLSEDLAFRRPLLRRVIDASERNLGFLRSQHSPIVEHLGAEAAPQGAGPRLLVDNGTKRADVGYAPGSLSYLRADWSGDAEAEKQIQVVESALLRQLARYCDPDGDAVVLGAGAGRHLFDLAPRFRSVLGVDLSYAFVHAFHRLTRADLSLALVELTSPVSRDEVVVNFTARLPPDRTPLDRLVYVAADALALPLASQSVSTVVMTFFADVVPLPKLLAEIRRVLAPNGRVLNFGPLDYHFTDVAWLLAPEEAEEVIRANGFEFEEQSWSEMTFFDQPRGYRRMYRVWSYVLRA